MQAQITAIKAKVAECIAAAEARFGVKMPYVQIRFDLTGRAAGIAGYTRRMDGNYFYLRFNTKHMALGGQTWEHLLNDTVPHEVAHTVCQAFPKHGRNHDAGWKRVCIALGGNGKRCYSEDDAPEAIAAQRPYVYTTTVGRTVRVSKVIHSKIQQGRIYSYKGGLGTLNRSCAYNYAAAVTATKPAVTAVKGSKADLVRARIQLAKANGEGSSTVVNYAVTTLGMSLSLAKTYTKNNWNK